MVFVTVEHMTEGENGAFIEERQDIVYLEIPERFTPPRRIPVPEGQDFDEAVAMDTPRLFRFSAATYNTHRIHYDLPYAQEVEKYPALVVHGPMQAAMLLEAAKRHSGHRPARFRFRGLHPMFHDRALRLTGRVLPEERAVDLCSAAEAGHQGMQARMEWD